MHIDHQSDRAMIGALRNRRAPRPWLQLLNAVLSLAGERAELLRHSETPWASATFSGSRHCVLLSFPGAEAVRAAEDFVEALPDHEFMLVGKLVADAAITSLEQIAGADACITLEAAFLLLDDEA